MQARICLVGRAKEDLEGRGMHALGLKDCRKGEWNALGAWRSMPGTEKAAGCLARGARGVQRPKRSPALPFAPRASSSGRSSLAAARRRSRAEASTGHRRTGSSSKQRRQRRARYGGARHDVSANLVYFRMECEWPIIKSSSAPSRVLLLHVPLGPSFPYAHPSPAARHHEHIEPCLCAAEHDHAHLQVP